MNEVGVDNYASMTKVLYFNPRLKSETFRKSKNEYATKNKKHSTRFIDAAVALLKSSDMSMRARFNANSKSNCGGTYYVVVVVRLIENNVSTKQQQTTTILHRK
jgi:hypothetical protein